MIHQHPNGPDEPMGGYCHHCMRDVDYAIEPQTRLDPDGCMHQVCAACFEESVLAMVDEGAAS